MRKVQHPNKQMVKKLRTESEKLMILREWEDCGRRTNLVASKHGLSGQTIRNWAKINGHENEFDIIPSRDLAQRELDSRILAEITQIDLTTAKSQLAVEGAREMIRRLANTNLLYSIKDKDLISLIKLSSNDTCQSECTSALSELEKSINLMRQASKQKL